MSQSIQGKELKKPPLWPSARLDVACLCFFGCVTLYIQTSCMSIGTVCMLNAQSVKEQETDGAFSWNKDKQELVLGAYFYGYSIPQIFIGIVAQRYSAKYVLLLGMTISTLGTLAIPLAANSGYTALIVVRFCMGLASSVVVPCLNVVWSRWAPQQERSVLVGGTFAGLQLGTVLSFWLSGQICDAFGWQFIFYLFGIFSAVWCGCWLVYLHDSPAQHPTISRMEREYIEDSAKQHSTPIKMNAIPLSSMLSSGPVWAAVVSQCCTGFGTYLTLTQLPSYFSNVLKLDIKSNGFYSACPSFALLIMINISTVTADHLRNYMSTTNVRKLMMILALCPQAAFLIATGYLDQSQTLAAVLLLTLSSGMSGCRNAGVTVNFGEIAPRYAGVLAGAANTIGFFAPMLSALLTHENAQSVEEWRRVFWVTGGVLVFGCVVFVLFGSAEPQSWAEDTEIEEKKEK